MIFLFYVALPGCIHLVSGLVWWYKDSFIHTSAVLGRWLEGWAQLVISLLMQSKGLSVWSLKGGGWSFYMLVQGFMRPQGKLPISKKLVLEMAECHVHWDVIGKQL